MGRRDVGPTHRVKVVTKVTKTRVGGTWTIKGGEGDLQGHCTYFRHQVLRSLGRGQFSTPGVERMMKEEGFDVLPADDE